ncbi:MAG: hypothetical protein U0263_11980 [Polyangiaceae bacterium]
MRRAAPFTVLLLAACASGRSSAPPPESGSERRPVAPTTATTNAPVTPPDAWLATCNAIASCGACLNAPPCHYCEGDGRCTSPNAPCSAFRVTESAACVTAPLEAARTRHPELASKLATYTSVREDKTYALGSFRQERFFMNAGDCFAILSELRSAQESKLDLAYAIQEMGTPDPTRKKPSPTPKSGGRSRGAELSPEYCAWENAYLVVSWLTPSATSTGDFRLRLLTRKDPNPVAPPQPATAAKPWAGGSGIPPGGSCSDFECGEDCRSELRACELDCFRYGRHEMGSQSLCKAGCNQALRSCERSCRIPCPR